MWVWITRRLALTIHREQIAAHGGGKGVRDLNLLESALARPRNLAAYRQADVADLAASYAFGIGRNHPFIDGNKRMAAVVSETFLNLNGFELRASDAEIVVVFLALAAGQIDETELADWFRERTAPAGPLTT